MVTPHKIPQKLYTFFFCSVMNSTREHHSVFSGVYFTSSSTDSVTLCGITNKNVRYEVNRRNRLESKGTSNSWEQQQLAKN